jgi:hypothetical protein
VKWDGPACQPRCHGRVRRCVHEPRAGQSVLKTLKVPARTAAATSATTHPTARLRDKPYTQRRQRQRDRDGSLRGRRQRQETADPQALRSGNYVNVPSGPCGATCRRVVRAKLHRGRRLAGARGRSDGAATWPGPGRRPGAGAGDWRREPARRRWLAGTNGGTGGGAQVARGRCGDGLWQAAAGGDRLAGQISGCTGAAAGTSVGVPAEGDPGCGCALSRRR